VVTTPPVLHTSCLISTGRKFQMTFTPPIGSALHFGIIAFPTPWELKMAGFLEDNFSAFSVTLTEKEVP